MDLKYIAKASDLDHYPGIKFVNMFKGFNPNVKFFARIQNQSVGLLLIHNYSPSQEMDYHNI